jgi:hypothetical protein
MSIYVIVRLDIALPARTITGLGSVLWKKTKGAGALVGVCAAHAKKGMKKGYWRGHLYMNGARAHENVGR